MVEALALLPDADLVIVGEGPERAAIEALARARGLANRVRLLGQMPQQKLPEIYGAADLLLLVSTHEGWPNVLLESMACGTPAVVSDIAGITDIVAAPAAGRIVPGSRRRTLPAQSATSSPRRPSAPPPALTPSSSTGRARLTGKSPCFVSFAPSSAATRPWRELIAAAPGHRLRHTGLRCAPSIARCR